MDPLNIKIYINILGDAENKKAEVYNWLYNNKWHDKRRQSSERNSVFNASQIIENKTVIPIGRNQNTHKARRKNNDNTNKYIRKLLNEEDLGYMVIKLNEEYTKVGSEVIIKRTEYMAIRDEEKTDLGVDKSVKIWRTDKLRYLEFTLGKKSTKEEEKSRRR